MRRRLSLVKWLVLGEIAHLLRPVTVRLMAWAVCAPLITGRRLAQPKPGYWGRK